MMDWKHSLYLLPVVAFFCGWLFTEAEVNLIAEEPARVSVIRVQKLRPEPKPEALNQLEWSASEDWKPDAMSDLRELAASYPAEVSELIAGLPEAQRIEVTYAVAVSWGACDPSSAFAWVDSMPQIDLTWDARRLVMASWMGVEPTKAFDHFMGLSEEQRRGMIEQELGSVLRNRLVDGYALAGIEMNHSLADIVLQNFPSGSVERAKMLVMMEESTVPEVRQRAVRVQGDDIFARDPLAAIAYEEDESGTYLGMLGRYAEQDPQGALEYALREKEHLGQVYFGWAKSEPQSALESVLRMPEAERFGAMEGWRKAVAESDPVAVAMSYLEDHAERVDGRNQPDLSTQSLVVHKWFALDPEAVTRWGATLTPQQGKLNVRQRLQSLWHQLGSGDARGRMLEGGFAETDLPPP